MKNISRKLAIALHALQEVIQKSGALERMEQEEGLTAAAHGEELAREKEQLKQDILQIRDGLSLIANSLD